jgi:hypothetical protein
MSTTTTTTRRIFNTTLTKPLMTSHGFNQSNITYFYPEVDMSISYEVITPVASYVAIVFFVAFLSIILVSRLIITVETKRSDLAIFSNVKLELLVSKQTSSASALHNMHAAIALGLMDPPPNYDPSKNTYSKSNGFASSSNLVETSEGGPQRNRKGGSKFK